MCVCVCPVNLISANREKWINNGKANSVADGREKGEGRARDGWMEREARRRGHGGNQGNEREMNGGWRKQDGPEAMS